MKRRGFHCLDCGALFKRTHDWTYCKRCRVKHPQKPIPFERDEP